MLQVSGVRLEIIVIFLNLECQLMGYVLFNGIFILFVNSFSTKVVILLLMSMKRFILVRIIQAVLGILNIKDVGYMRGVIDYLVRYKRKYLLAFFVFFLVSGIICFVFWGESFIQSCFIYIVRVEGLERVGWQRIYRIFVGSR